MKEYSAYQQTESYKQFMKLKYTGMTQKQKHIRDPENKVATCLTGDT